MDGFPAPWWFAGGQAIDAFLGYESREHGDIDIGCFREDQLAMQRQLSGLELWYADAPYQFMPWRDGEVLPAHAHDIWARGSAGLPWCLQLMLDEREGQDWVYRRNPAVRRPINSFITFRHGVPYIAAEVQLLYKSPSAHRVPKNVLDFENCLPCLDETQRRWLAYALHTCEPGHPWIARLDSLEPPEKLDI